MRACERVAGSLKVVGYCILGSLLLTPLALADKAGDVAALEAKCEAEREARIKPLREEEIRKCNADGRFDAGYCERFYKDFGNGANRGRVPRLFGDLPACKLALSARKALANGDPLPTASD